MATTGYANGNYKLRGAFVNAAQLTDTYLVTAFPIFADMAPLSEWFDPEGSNVYNQAAAMEQSLYGGGKFIGNENFSWIFAGLTPQMLTYFLTDASLFNSLAEMDATVETWNMAKNQWEIVWAVATVGIISEAGETGYRRGLRSLTVPFLVKQDAP